mgnify:CR=1 FL=1
MLSQIMKSVLPLLLCGACSLSAALVFPNPSLEEDADNIGCPDGWSIPKDTVVKLVRDKVTHGDKAGCFTDGYILLFCDQQQPGLAGTKLNISFDAAGIEGAQLGVRIGYYRDDDGKLLWTDSVLTWNRNLTEEYKRIELEVTLPENVVKERFFFAVYRSNRKGTVWLDNFNLVTGKKLSADDRKAMNRLGRDVGYCVAKLQQAQQRKPGNAVLTQVDQELDLLQKRLKEEDASLLHEAVPALLQGSLARINQVLAKEEDFALWIEEACKRQEPDEIMSEQNAAANPQLALQNEYVAFGIGLANCRNQVVTIPVRLSGYEGFSARMQLRRQVFMENWYKKEQELTADPMPLLPGGGGDWELLLQPGETCRLFLLFKVKPDVQGDFTIRLEAGAKCLDLQLRVLSQTLPKEPFFANFQCIYPDLGVAGRHPAIAAKDLAEHYTTGIEFPFLPKVEFNEDGTLAREDFAQSAQASWMLAYAKENIQLGLFWQGKYARFPLAGKEEFLPYQDEAGELFPVWRTAYATLLEAWLKFAESKGVPGKCWLNWGMDELASHEDFANAPGRKVRHGIEVYKLGRKVAPQIRTMITAGNYTLPADVAAFLPYIDVILPHWPMPEKLGRWAPPDFCPREQFFNKTLPLLKAERERRGLIIWSYKVDAGKREPELNARVYPVAAVGIGFTGVGSWAYNCASGSTWDDTDGKILDYIFVYDGEEKHPLNQQCNPTGEKIIPSIRWEAFRMGIQDAKILLWLKEHLEKRRGDCSPEIAMRIEKCLRIAEAFGRDMDYSWNDALDLSQELRKLLQETREKRK